MEKIQDFFNTNRNTIFLIFYACCIVPWSTFLISLAGVYNNYCTPLGIWGMIYGIYFILSPLFLIPPMIYPTLTTKKYTFTVSFLSVIGFTSMFISGIVLIVKSSWMSGCMEGGGFVLWIFSLLNILCGLVTTAGGVYTLHEMWKASEEREGTGYYH